MSSLWLITAPERETEWIQDIFTNLHLDQFTNARLAFQVEILQNGLRRLAVDTVKATAALDFDKGNPFIRNLLPAIESETGACGGSH